MRVRTKRPEILFEDEDVLVCVKPAGMAVESARSGQTDLISFLKTYRARKREEPYVGMIHRLDQPVEGVMVFAKTKAAAAALSRQVAEHRADKEYMAVIRWKDEAFDRMLADSPKEASGDSSESEICYVLEDYLLRDGRTNTSSVVAKDTRGAKKARLTFRVLERAAAASSEAAEGGCGGADCEHSGAALVAVRLETGRHHQIRVQFASRGCALYGDTKYGEPLPEGSYLPVALCSRRIGFTHPKTKKRMDFTIDPTDRFRGYLRAE